MTVRTSQTWDFETGRQLRLGTSLWTIPDMWKRSKNWIEYEIAQRLKADPSTYFDNYPEYGEAPFRRRTSISRSQGIVLYYQHYDIAPYSVGFPNFFCLFWGNGAKGG